MEQDHVKVTNKEKRFIDPSGSGTTHQMFPEGAVFCGIPIWWWASCLMSHSGARVVVTFPLPMESEWSWMGSSSRNDPFFCDIRRRRLLHFQLSRSSREEEGLAWGNACTMAIAAFLLNVVETN